MRYRPFSRGQPGHIVSLFFHVFLASAVLAGGFILIGCGPDEGSVLLPGEPVAVQAKVTGPRFAQVAVAQTAATCPEELASIHPGHACGGGGVDQIHGALGLDDGDDEATSIDPSSLKSEIEFHGIDATADIKQSRGDFFGASERPVDVGFTLSTGEFACLLAIAEGYASDVPSGIHGDCVTPFTPDSETLFEMDSREPLAVGALILFELVQRGGSYPARVDEFLTAIAGKGDRAEWLEAEGVDMEATIAAINAGASGAEAVVWTKPNTVSGTVFNADGTPYTGPINVALWDFNHSRIEAVDGNFSVPYFPYLHTPNGVIFGGTFGCTFSIPADAGDVDNVECILPEDFGRVDLAVSADCPKSGDTGLARTHSEAWVLELNKDHERQHLAPLNLDSTVTTFWVESGCVERGTFTFSAFAGPGAAVGLVPYRVVTGPEVGVRFEGSAVSEHAEFTYECNEITNFRFLVIAASSTLEPEQRCFTTYFSARVEPRG